MTKLEKLIQELCPNGVEYKPLLSVIQSIRNTLSIGFIPLRFTSKRQKSLMAQK